MNASQCNNPISQATMPPWVDIVVKPTPAFVTLIIGLVGGSIAFLQYRVGRNKLRLDLFEKRLAAYEKLQEFFSGVFRTGRVEDTSLPILAQARYKSRFLFGPEIEDSFEILWKKAVGMMTVHHRMYGPDSLPVGPERTKVCDEHHVLLLWMIKEMEQSSGRYAKYLHFK